jgi:glycosyltransferase involved in cell wall biosynthesis
MRQFGLRIAIDGRPALWPRTGLGTIARNVLSQMQHVHANCSVFAYFDRHPGEFVSSLGPVQSSFGGPRHKLMWSNSWLLRQLARDRIDVFVTFLEKEIPLLPTASKVVVMVHDLIPLRLPDVVFRNVVHRAYYNALIRMAAKRADLVLTNSEFSKAEITSLLRVGESKVQRISLGAEKFSRISEADSDVVLSRYGLKRPFAIALGSTEPRKNNGRVIEALRLLSLQHPHLRLAIAGSPWRGVPFDNELNDLRVLLLGHVPDEDLRAIMSSAELLVFPSLHEGFGFPVLEAMSLGVPVVTSNRTALPEVGGDAVLYADPMSVCDIAAKMNLILSDKALANSLGERGRERARSFQWENTCAEIVDLCASLVETRQWQRQPALR